jgi:site-specific recombinase XerD
VFPKSGYYIHPPPRFWEQSVELNRCAVAFTKFSLYSLAHFPLSSKEKRKVFFMQDYLQLMTTSMELKGFAKSTQKTYLAHLRRFAEFSGKLPAPAGYDDVRAFLYHAISVRKLSSAYVNSAYGAIKFFFQTALCREWNMLHVPRVKKKYSLPVILSPQEVFQTINATNNLKHKAMLSTIYSAGLRVSEVAHLKVADIDSSRMRIFVRQAKGNKDRYSILSENNLFLLREYWKLYRPKDWLFPGLPDKLASKTLRKLALEKKYLGAQIGVTMVLHTWGEGETMPFYSKNCNLLSIGQFIPIFYDKLKDGKIMHSP